MKGNIKVLGTILLLLSSLIFYFNSAAVAHTEDDPFIADLIAGGGNEKSQIDVGDILVWNDADFLYVKYVLMEAGWCLLETHLHVADDPLAIPQKNGNPIPGQFELPAMYFEPCTTYEYTYVIPLDWPSCIDIYIAAHAVVATVSSECLLVVSDASAEWSADGAAWEPAVACWVHSSWTDIAGATWIWRTYETDPLWEYNNVPEGGWYFRKSFALPSTAFGITASAVAANGDNAYTIALNGVSLVPGGEGVMDKDDPNHGGWSTIVDHVIPAGVVADGDNELQLRAMNYYDWGGPYDNPAGLAFKVEVCYDYIDREETAWGDGTDFEGKNWATYITYHVQGEIPELWPEGGTLSVAYEDLPINQGNDWDYNDFVVDIDTLATFWGTPTDKKLIQMDFTVRPEVKIAGYTHVMHLDADVFSCSGAYELYRDGSLVESGAYDPATGIDVVLVPNTGSPPTTVLLTISWPMPGCAFSFPTWDQSLYHGENLFYDPYLYVTDTGETIHTGDVRMLTVPVDWQWPTPDGNAIWNVYPKVTAGAPPTFVPYWWTP